MKEATNSLKKTAKLAGLLWLLAAAGGSFALVYVRPKLIVIGDAAATAANLSAHESLFRLGIAAALLGQIFLLFFGLTLFRVFKEFNKTLATVLLTAIMVSVAVGAINSLKNIGALIVLSDAGYLKAFGQDQINALMMIFLRLSGSGIGLHETFLSLALFTFGLLIIKSNYLPRILGILLMIGSCAFPFNFFTKLLVPTFYPAVITQLTMLLNAPGILSILWLLIKGVNARRAIGEN